jgi:hypothetical protein
MMQFDECFLLASEIWYFNHTQSFQTQNFSLDFDKQMSMFSENKSILDILDYYVSQFRLEPIHVLPKNL